MLDFARPGASTEPFLLKSLHFKEDLRGFGRGGGFFNDPAFVRSALKDVGAAYHYGMFAARYFCERWLSVRLVVNTGRTLSHPRPWEFD